MIVALYKFPRLYILELEREYYNELVEITDPFSSLSPEPFILSSKQGIRIDDIVKNHSKILYETDCDDILLTMVEE